MISQKQISEVLSFVKPELATLELLRHYNSWYKANTVMTQTERKLLETIKMLCDRPNE